jgi:hypothetical protein
MPEFDISSLIGGTTSPDQIAMRTIQLVDGLAGRD